MLQRLSYLILNICLGSECAALLYSLYISTFLLEYSKFQKEFRWTLASLSYRDANFRSLSHLQSKSMDWFLCDRTFVTEKLDYKVGSCIRISNIFLKKSHMYIKKVSTFNP